MRKTQTRREAMLFAAASTGAALLAAAPGALAQQRLPDNGRQSPLRQMSAETMKACVDACHACQRVCLETLTYCLDKGGPHAAAARIRLLLDCAEICQTNANFMMRASSFHMTLCNVCAQICRRCAASCDFEPSDVRLTECAKQCRTCLDSCRSMAMA